MGRVKFSNSTSVIILIAGLFLVAGCGEEKKTPKKCSGNSDCAAPKPVCDSGSGKCVECLISTDCEEGYRCANNACEAVPPCTSDADCADPVAAKCEVTSGKCVECVADPDCDEGEECTEVYECQQIPPCASDPDCADPALPWCDSSSGRCVECLETPQCEKGFYCSETRTCEAVPGCALNDDCIFAEFPYCEKGNGACVQCLVNEHCDFGSMCGSDFTCVETDLYQCNPREEEPACPDIDQICLPPGLCAPAQDPETGGIVCADNEDCALHPGAVCDTTAGRCTYCYAGTCSGNMVCNGTTGWCEESASCANDGDCLADRLCAEGSCRNPACDPDDFEPNDTSGAAADIAAGAYSLAYCGNEDWYRIAMKQGDGLVVEMWDNTAMDLDLMVYASGTGDPTLLAISESIFDYESVKLSKVEADGDYLVRVSGFLPPGATWENHGPYKLTIRTLTGGICFDDAVEPNNDPTQAALLDQAFEPSLTICGNDEDWFTADDFEEDAEIGLVLRHAGSPVVFEAYEDAGTTLLATGVADQEALTLDATYSPATAYYWKIGPAQASADNWADYTLEISSYTRLAEKPGCESAQPVSFDQDGVAIATGTTSGTGASFSSICSRFWEVGEGPENVYSFELTGMSLVEAEVSASFAPVVYFREDCANLVSEMDCATGTGLKIPLEPGEYYVFVDGQSAMDMGGYTLTLKAAPVECIGDEDCQDGKICNTLAYECEEKPANETCESAAPLTLPASVQSANTGLQNDYDLTPELSCTGYAAEGPDLVYSFDLSAGDIIVCSLESAFDAALYILTDCAAPDSSCVAGADEVTAGTEEIAYAAAAEGNHFLVVDGYSALDYGGFTLKCDMGECMSNEDCAGETYCVAYMCVARTVENDTCDDAVEVAAGSYEGTTTGSINDYSAQRCTYYAQKGPDVVYSASLAQNDRLKAVLYPAGDTDFGLYLVSDCADAEASCVAGADEGQSGASETLDYTAAEAGTYFLIVDSYFRSQAGDFTLSIEINP